MCAMNNEARLELEHRRVRLSKLFQKYEFASADIAPPIKVLDGMPYSQTNNVGSMTEAKAERLVDIANMINTECERVVELLNGIDRIDNETVRYFIQLRYICAYSWGEIKKKTRTEKSADNIRKTVNYYMEKI